jgi:perosamine synthetase
MIIDTLIFDSAPCGFPAPRVPLLPVGLDGVLLKPQPIWAPAENFRHFARGRYALREAYRLAGIGPGTALLAPAYHCRTMLDPALAHGGEVLLYPLWPDLSPDLGMLEDIAARSLLPVKVLLATHFFGIPQDFTALADWCATRGITLVEDCSHVLFCEHHRPPGIGNFGEFVISSPYKFLPSPDGGLLYSRNADRLKALRVRASSWLDELRGAQLAWLRCTEQRHNRPTLDPSRIDTELASLASHRLPSATDHHERAGTSADYRHEHEHLSGLRLSRMIYHHPDIVFITSQRRDNYRRWSIATMNLPYCKPLYPELPEGCIPYMFPLLIEQPEPHFYRLKHLGVPIWRWDSIAASNCATANDYRLHLLHLPCHQSLNHEELDWMIAAICKVIAGGPTRMLQ